MGVKVERGLGLLSLLKSPGNGEVLHCAAAGKVEMCGLNLALHHVFGEENASVTLAVDNRIITQNLHRYLADQVERRLNEARRFDSGRDQPRPSGEVQLDGTSGSGDVVVEGWGLESRSNFGSRRTVASVDRGKWQYEVTLGTAGIQQLGWSTRHTVFTNEAGVGDSPDSYAFDGNRQNKWNDQSYLYGEKWAEGDIIGCCIDLNNRTVSFFRNGFSLGVAFKDIKRANYHAAISLSLGERCEVNFGVRPLQFPVEGYSPLVDPPMESSAASYMLAALYRLVSMMCELESRPWRGGADVRHDVESLEEVFSLVIRHLAPLLSHTYTKESSVMRYLGDLELQGPHPLARGAGMLARYLREIRGPPLEREVFLSVFRSLARACRTARLIVSEGPVPALRLAIGLLQQAEVRDLWLASPRWQEDLEGLLTIKAPTPVDLEGMIPWVYWEGVEREHVSGFRVDQQHFRGCTANLEMTMANIELLHMHLCWSLLHTPLPRSHRPHGHEGMPTDCFQYYVAYLLHKNRGAVRNMLPPGLSNASPLCSTFFVMLAILHPYVGDSAFAPAGAPLSFPAGHLFFQGVKRPLGQEPLTPVPGDRYHGHQRLGGTISHLAKELPPSDVDRLATFCTSRLLSHLQSSRESNPFGVGVPRGKGLLPRQGLLARVLDPVVSEGLLSVLRPVGVIAPPAPRGVAPSGGEPPEGRDAPLRHWERVAPVGVVGPPAPRGVSPSGGEPVEGRDAPLRHWEPFASVLNLERDFRSAAEDPLRAGQGAGNAAEAAGPRGETASASRQGVGDGREADPRPGVYVPNSGGGPMEGVELWASPGRFFGHALPPFSHAGAPEPRLTLRGAPHSGLIENAGGDGEDHPMPDADPGGVTVRTSTPTPVGPHQREAPAGTSPAEAPRTPPNFAYGPPPGLHPPYGMPFSTAFPAVPDHSPYTWRNEHPPGHLPLPQASGAHGPQFGWGVPGPYLDTASGFFRGPHTPGGAPLLYPPQGHPSAAPVHGPADASAGNALPQAGPAPWGASAGGGESGPTGGAKQTGPFQGGLGNVLQKSQMRRGPHGLHFVPVPFCHLPPGSFHGPYTPGGASVFYPPQGHLRGPADASAENAPPNARPWGAPPGGGASGPAGPSADNAPPNAGPWGASPGGGAPASGPSGGAPWHSGPPTRARPAFREGAPAEGGLAGWGGPLGGGPLGGAPSAGGGPAGGCPASWGGPLGGGPAGWGGPSLGGGPPGPGMPGGGPAGASGGVNFACPHVDVTQHQAAQLLDAALHLFHVGPADKLKAAAQDDTNHESRLRKWTNARVSWEKARKDEGTFMIANHVTTVNLAAAHMYTCGEEMAASVRESIWREITLCSQAKMDGLFRVCSYVARLLQVIAMDRTVFPYVPEFYVDALVQAISLTRMWPKTREVRTFVWQSFLAHAISFLSLHFDDRAIINPDLHEAMLGSIAHLVKRKGLMPVCETNKAARQRLAPALVSSFASGKHWCSVVHILISLVEGSGFQEPAARSASLVFQEAVQRAFAADEENALNRLFNLLTYTLTEFFIHLKELDPQTIDPTSKAKRRLGAMLDISKVLGRLLEFLTLKLDGSFFLHSPINLARTAETLAFVLSQGLACTPIVAALNGAYTLGHTYRQQLLLEELLAPFVGVVHNLFMKEDVSNVRLLTDLQSQRRGKFWDYGRAIVEALAAPQLALNPACLQLLARQFWEKPRCVRDADPDKRRQLEDLERIAGILKATLEDPGRSGSGGAVNSDDDIPEDFLDPLVLTLMRDPVILPDSHITVDRATIERHLLSAANDPFTRSALTLAACLPDVALRARIEAWRDGNAASTGGNGNPPGDPPPPGV